MYKPIKKLDELINDESVNELINNELIHDELINDEFKVNHKLLVMDGKIYNELSGYGCRFVKIIGKNNPKKELLEKSIANSIDDINTHLRMNKNHSIKIKLAGTIHVLDIDVHEGSTSNKDQTDILEKYFAHSGFFTDRSPRGIHLFFVSENPIL